MQVTRRDALAGLGGALVAGAAARVVGEPASASDASTACAFDGSHQAGVVTARQAHLTLAAFDLVTPDSADVARLLSDWTASKVALCERGEGAVAGPGAGAELGPAGLTITVGLGAGLFDARYGLRDRRPAGLEPRDEAGLDASRSGGDLLVQVCGDDRQLVFHATHQLSNAALGIARRRWTQHGFLSRPRPDATPRGVIGFKDGTANVADAASLARHVWVAGGDDAGGMAGGTYLVYRRVRVRLQAWDRSAVAEQERVIGRRKVSGAPLGGRDEAQPVALASMPPRSHVRAMHPDANGGVRLLRRSYNYDDGATPDGETDAGIAFVAFTSDPAGTAGRLLRRYEQADDLRRYAVPTAGAVFAIPPAPGPGEHVGQRLLGGAA